MASKSVAFLHFCARAGVSQKDKIEMITKVTGIKAAVGAISELVHVPCGCQERKEKLNKLFPYEKSN